MMDQTQKRTISIKENWNSIKNIEPQYQIKNGNFKHHRNMEGRAFWITVMMKWDLRVKKMLNHQFQNLKDDDKLVFSLVIRMIQVPQKSHRNSLNSNLKILN